jgi:hypothetical protein
MPTPWWRTALLHGAIQVLVRLATAYILHIAAILVSDLSQGLQR